MWGGHLAFPSGQSFKNFNIKTTTADRSRLLKTLKFYIDVKRKEKKLPLIQ